MLSNAQARPHQEWVELMRRVVEFTSAANQPRSAAIAPETNETVQPSQVASDSARALRQSESILANELNLAPEIPTPEAFLGYELGSKHIRHHELVAYVKKLCDASPRLHCIALGKTFEGRELVTVAVSKPRDIDSSEPTTKSPEQASFAEVIGLRKKWLESKPGEVKLNNRVPSVAYFAYGVHGNESSPSNSSVLVLYLLAAAQGDWIDGILDQSIVLVDPCLNPDGYDRYVQWLENNQGSIVSSDSSDLEHNERSPSSRTNHFGFDLNRDWLPATQSETRNRLKLYYDWLPNLVLDVHEMGASQSLFFSTRNRRA